MSIALLCCTTLDLYRTYLESWSEMRLIFLVALVIVSLPILAIAEQIVEPGARIRIVDGNNSEIGIFDRVDDGHIYFRGGGEGAWSLRSVDKIEVSAGKSRQTMLGGMVGFVAGFGLGYLAGTSADSPETAALPFFGLWAGATVAGFMIGNVIQVDRWVPASLRHASLEGSESTNVETRVGLVLAF